MFDDQQTNQTQTDSTDTNDNSADQDGFSSNPVTDLSMNPTGGLSQDDSTDASASPTVVMPTVHNDDVAEDEVDSDSSSDSDDSPILESPPTEDSSTVTTDSGSSSPVGELADIKRQALEQLSPLVHKLDQNPEDKYWTLMMLIQASDNPEFLNEAYDAAQQISDEKERAEALLDIVNEINYFTKKASN